MPPDLALGLTLLSSNYPCLEHTFKVSKVFKPLKIDYIYTCHIFQQLLKLILDRMF